MGEVSFFRCERCGNIITKIIDAGPTPFCCGEQMVELTANTVDAAVEKHVPVINVVGNKVIIEIGSAPHPMTEEHYISWVYIETEKGGQRKELRPGSKPYIEFALTEDDTFESAYAYCNLHGLWKSNL